MSIHGGQRRIEYLGRVCLVLVGRVVEWSVLLALAVLLLAAARWLWVH